MASSRHRIRVGTASWTDKTLLASGWYPESAGTPEKRLQYYASQFPLVEVDATYYTPPAEQTAKLWAERTPKGFVFNIKAFGLLTGHPTKLSSIYKDLRPETDKRNIYPGDLTPEAYEEVWNRFLSALEPLAERAQARVDPVPVPAVVHHQAAQQGVPRRGARTGAGRTGSPWSSATQPGSRATTARRRSSGSAASRSRTSASTCHRATRSSIPPVIEATSDLAVVRFHGHSEKWTSKDIYEKFGYLYSEKELKTWAPKLRKLSQNANETHVLMNNCYSDYAQRNAQQLIDFLAD